MPGSLAKPTAEPLDPVLEMLTFLVVEQFLVEAIDRFFEDAANPLLGSYTILDHGEPPKAFRGPGLGVLPHRWGRFFSDTRIVSYLS